VFNVYEQIAHLSPAMTLEPGDTIFTGTPGAVRASNVCRGGYRLIGTVTITGMIFSSGFAIFLVPALFVIVERLSNRQQDRRLELVRPSQTVKTDIAAE
jgi:2-keto-4-pentenoate hydratase/2-oxohepta-3-ene-1,7-dioic acid hydratase in catechol pathway